MPNDTEEPKKGANRLKKEAIVEEIKAALDNSSAIVLTNYQGLTHRQLEDMKKKLKTVNSTFAITKNTLLKLSLSESKSFADKIAPENLNEPTATLFISGDPVEALKIIQKVAKDTGLLKIKVGIIDGATLDEASVIKLSTLPNRDTLIAQFVGTLNSPIQGLVIVLNGNIQKLAMVLSAVAKNKPQEAAVPTQAEPAAQTEQPTEQVQTAPLAQAETPTEQTSENNEQTNDKGGENSN